MPINSVPFRVSRVGKRLEPAVDEGDSRARQSLFTNVVSPLGDKPESTEDVLLQHEATSKKDNLWRPRRLERRFTHLNSAIPGLRRRAPPPAETVYVALAGKINVRTKSPDATLTEERPAMKQKPQAPRHTPVASMTEPRAGTN